MNSAKKCSFLLVSLLFFCFAPCAFGQPVSHLRSQSAQRRITSDALPITFLFSLLDNGKPHPGWDDPGKKDHDPHKCDPRKDCVAVPEGGSALAYLLLAGLTCACVIAWRSRRHDRATGAA